MKNYGNIRIDEVGRITIPKEVQKVLKLDETRLLEMFIEKDKLIIKRYAPFFNNYDFIKKISLDIANALGAECVIGTLNKVVACSCESLEPLENKSLSNDFVALLKGKAPLILNVKDGGTMVSITENNNICYNSLALVDIVSDVSKLGFICLLGLNENSCFKSTDLSVLKIARTIILSAIES